MQKVLKSFKKVLKSQLVTQSQQVFPGLVGIFFFPLTNRSELNYNIKKKRSCLRRVMTYLNNGDSNAGTIPGNEVH